MRLLNLHYGPFRRIGDRYNTLIDGNHFLGRNPFEDLWMSPETITINKGEKERTLEIPLPGVKKKQLKIHLENNILKIDVIRDDSKEYNTVRVFFLSDEIDTDTLSAYYKNGLLKVVCRMKPDWQIKNQVIPVE